jgi:uncharacterized membrane protein YjgN (DUF898 family)
VDDLTVTSEPRISERAVFQGEGWEYFKIWIVNVALSILTIGVFSAWAKVRRLQYFYRNTRLAGASFDYHGDPMAILKGRLIAAVLFGGYSVASALNPLVAIGIFLLIILVMPWLTCRSLKFRMHNTSYRGIRFRFLGTTGEAYWVYLGLPVLVVLSIFTLLPLWHHRAKEYQYGSASYGQVPFAMGAPVREFYVTYLATLALGAGVLLVAGGVFVSGLLAVAAAAVATSDGMNEPPPEVFMAVVPVFLLAAVIYVAGITAVQGFLTGRIRNVVWDHMSLGSYRFTSDIRTWPLVRLLLGNLFATIVTVGLFWPFAQVRLARYLTATMRVEGPPSLGEFAASPAADEQAVGEEVSEFFDFDVGF